MDSRSLVPGDVISLHAAIFRLSSSMRNRFSLPKDALLSITHAVDRETYKLQMIITSLRQHLNELSPIWVLPDELLLLIFKEISTEPRTRTANVAKASQVCRRWRDIAIRCSSLWDTITESTAAWTHTLCERNGVGPLYILWEALTPPRQTALQRAFDQLPKTKTLSLRLSKRELESFIDYSYHDTPLLDSLNIARIYTGSDDENEEEDFLATWEFDRGILVLPNSPSLRRVHLIDVQLLWPEQARVWPTLTTLHLEGTKTPADPERLMFLYDLLGTLRRLPQLESLILRHFCSQLRSLRPDEALENLVPRLLEDPTADAMSSHAVNMPALRQITIDAPDNESLVEILRHLKIPPGCCISLATDPDNSRLAAEITADLLSKALIVLACRYNPAPWKILEVVEEEEGEVLCFTVWNGDVSSSVSVNQLNPDGWKVILQFLKKFPNLRQIQELTVSYRTEYAQEDETWPCLSSISSQISSLEVEFSSAVKSLITAFRASPAESPLFPQLNALWVGGGRGVEFHHELQLAGVLRKRTLNGLRLETFTFHYADAPSGKINWTETADELDIIERPSNAES